jgi:DNA polymerase III delta prime subunit
MKNIEITLQQLFDFIGHQELEYDEFKSVDEEIFVLTPTNDYTKLRGIIKKQDNKMKLSGEGFDFICGENHILISKDGNEVFAKDSLIIQSLDGSVEVKTKEFIGFGDVYDIALDAPHLYVTPNKIVHHNTTAAKAICDEIGADVLYINASLENGIDVLRSKISQFASTVSFGDGIKVVILDEADGLNASTFQPALRGFIEAFSENCRFILTCNYVNKLIEPIHSRCSIIDFKISKEEKQVLAGKFFKRATEILKLEGIEFDQKVVAEVVTKHFPDYRRVLNELQRYSVSGKIDSGILVNQTADSFKDLVKLIKDKNFTEVRKWVGTNDTDTIALFRDFYDYSNEYVEPASIPQLILILADYQYKASFVADQELNLMAALTEIMSSIQFK